MKPAKLSDLKRMLRVQKRVPRPLTANTTTKAGKDAVTLTISIFALIISALSAYWTIIRQVDDLRVVISGAPKAIYKDDHTIEFWITNGNLTFTNLGNRSAAVVSALLNIKLPGSNGDKCTEGGNSWLLDVSAVVIKAGDISVQSTRLAKGNDNPILYPVEFRTGENVNIETCMIFNVITPDNTAIEKKVLIREFAVSNVATDKIRDHLDFLPGKPEILVKKWGLAF
jgi:hypothetical protein